MVYTILYLGSRGVLLCQAETCDHVVGLLLSGQEIGQGGDTLVYGPVNIEAKDDEPRLMDSDAGNFVGVCPPF